MLGVTAGRSNKRYSCKACCFSTSVLLDFLIHVQKMHFDRHASKHEIVLPASPAAEAAQSNQWRSSVPNGVSSSQESDTCCIHAVKEEFVPAEEINKFNNVKSDNTGGRHVCQEQLHSVLVEESDKVGTRSSKCSRGKTINQIIDTLKEEYSAGGSNSATRSTIFQHGVASTISENETSFKSAPTVSDCRNILGTRSLDDCLDNGSLRSMRMNSTHDHYVSIQSLLLSGLVTMPQADILRSIICDSVTWKSIQARLHSSFCKFPYLTEGETQILSNVTGLTVQQIKTLFVVARLQHSISWGQEEITAARNYLNIPANRFLTT